MNILCLFKHKDGKKEVSYVDEYGEHYMSKCLRCGTNIFYETEAEKFIKTTKKRANDMVDEMMKR